MWQVPEMVTNMIFIRIFGSQMLFYTIQDGCLVNPQVSSQSSIQKFDGAHPEVGKLTSPCRMFPLNE